MNTCPKCGITYSGAEVFCPKDGTRLASGSAMRRRRQSMPPDVDPLIGKIIQGRYRVIDQLGEGGMGVVYVAEHVEIEKKVALKVLRDDFSKRPEVVERFRQEAKSASRIGHANIVDVTDFGQLDDGGVYFVMEHLQGESLSDVIRGRTMELKRAQPIVKQIARALNAAHKLGIVHRDLKPENIFLVEREDEKDFVKILDFGIAKISDRDSEGKRLTQTGMIFGTPEYMSPEQASGKKLDHRVDVYALGCIMFEMFTGRVPFDGESFMAVLTQHMFEPVPAIEVINPSTDVPPSIRAIVYRAMAKEKNDRYADMAALVEDLERVTGDITEADQFNNTAGHGDLAYRERANLETEPLLLSDTADKRGRPFRGKLIGAAIVGLIAIGAIGTYVFGLVGNETDKIQTNTLGNQEKLSDGFVEPQKQDSHAKQNGESEGIAKDEGSDNENGGQQHVKAGEKILVQIRAIPASARISVEGLGQVCSNSPCDIELEPNRTVRVEARVGQRKAEMMFTPSEQNRELALEVKTQNRRSVRRTKTHKQDTEKKASQDEPAKKEKSKAGELKIPDVFKDG